MGEDGDIIACVIDIGALRSLPYFSRLKEAELREVARLVQAVTLTRGEVLLTGGEPCPGLYFVVSGSLKVFQVSPEGREQVLMVAGPGQSFNDVPVFDGGPNPASVEALEPSAVGLVPKEAIEDLVRRYPEVARGMLQVFARRLRLLVSLVTSLSLLSVEGRVGQVLLTFSDTAPQPRPRLRVSQQDLAAMVGTTREVVARSLRALEEAGAVRRLQTEIEVVDRKRLAEMVEQAFK